MILRRSSSCVLLSAVVFCLSLSAHGETDPIEVDAGNYRTPLKMVSLSDYPIFNDDQDLQNMKLAIDRQLVRFKKKSLTGTIHMGDKSYPLTKVQQSLEVFSQMVDSFDECLTKASRETCYQDLNLLIRQKFNVFVPNLAASDPRHGDENFAKFTGYHTHHIEGRLQPEGEFKHAIYSNPTNRKLKSKTRFQIDFGDALAGLGLEGVYTKNLFDIYLMHVAGSGRATIPQPDGSVKEFYLQFDGTNNQRWQFISLYMAKKGYIVNGSIPSQRRFLREHPELEREIFSQCPSYVYLKPTDKPPLGSDVVPVTGGRTLATDNAYYPFKGLLAYIQSERPTETGNYNLDEELKSNIPFSSFSRFMVDQDTGGAINGKARADIYFGADDYAFFAAMHEDELGKLHYLMLK